MLSAPLKILILGPCGAGKSTLARKLRDQLGHPIIHLDQHYWQAGWVETPEDEWRDKLIHLMQAERWIMDGNYHKSLDLRLPEADFVIHLNAPTLRSLWRVTKRVRRYRGRTRPDMPAGCPERWDWGFMHYVATFNHLRTPLVMQKLAALDPQRVRYLRSKKEARRLQDELSRLHATSGGRNASDQ